MTVPLVELRDVRKTFPAAGGGDAVEAIRGVDLTVEAGEIVGIVGYSGAGKSTLVRLINALETATSGSVKVDGRRSPACASATSSGSGWGSG